MSKLDWYILKQSTLMIALVLFSIAGLLLVTGIADEAARRVNETYTLRHALIFKLSTLPIELYEYIGVIVMLGTLIAIASFNKHQELTVIQLTSPSALKLILKLILPSLLLLPFIFYAGEWLGPSLYKNAERVRAELIGKNSNVLRGQWFKAGDEFINVQHVSDNQLVGINRFKPPKENTFKANQAESAIFNESGWTLTNNRTFSISEKNVARAKSEAAGWYNSKFTPESIQNVLVAPKHLAILEFRDQVTFKQDAGTLNSATEQAYWGRLLFPIEYIALVLIALSFSFGSFRQKTVGDAAFKTIISGVAAGLIVDSFSAALMVLNFPASLATAISICTLMFIGIKLINKQY